MGELQLITNSEFRKFLEHIGCEYKRQRGDHIVYTKKGINRPIIFRVKGDIPILHLKTNLKTLGLTAKQFLEILNKIK